jgi:hypothetical protein
VLLDDRGGIRIGDRSSVSDFANVYSHTHDIVDPAVVSTPATVLGDGVRITYHATVLAGVHVADDSMVGAMALATRDTEPSTVHVGIPARPVKRKPEPGRPGTSPDPLGAGAGLPGLFVPGLQPRHDIGVGQRRRVAERLPLGDVAQEAPHDLPGPGLREVGREEHVSGRAMARSFRHVLRSSCPSASRGRRPSFSVTKAAMACPFSSCAFPPPRPRRRPG